MNDRQFYPISLINNIIEDFPQQHFGILYDIGCHLKRHMECVSLLIAFFNQRLDEQRTEKVLNYHFSTARSST